MIEPQDVFEEEILNIPHFSNDEKEEIIFSHRKYKEEFEKKQQQLKAKIKINLQKRIDSIEKEKLQLQILKNKFNG